MLGVAEEPAKATGRDLDEALEKFVTARVATGRYRSESGGVLREGVRPIQQREGKRGKMPREIAREPPYLLRQAWHPPALRPSALSATKKEIA